MSWEWIFNHSLLVHWMVRVIDSDVYFLLIKAFFVILRLVAHTFGIRLIYPGTLFSFLLRGTLEVRKHIISDLLVTLRLPAFC